MKNLAKGERPDSLMTICEPIEFDPIDSEDLKVMTEWLVKLTNREPTGFTSEQTKIAKGNIQKN